MKRVKILAGSIVVSVVVAVTVNVSLSRNATDGSMLHITNVEALAQGEGYGEGGCTGSGNIKCGNNYYGSRVNR